MPPPLWRVDEVLRGGEQSQGDKVPPVFSCSQRPEGRSRTLLQTRVRDTGGEAEQGMREKDQLSSSRCSQGREPSRLVPPACHPGFPCPAPEQAHKDGEVTVTVKGGSLGPSTSTHNLPKGNVTEQRPMACH